MVSWTVSSLLASIALRSCSSSYAASRLFMVDLRLLAWEELGRRFLDPGLGDRVPSLETEAAREVD